MQLTAEDESEREDINTILSQNNLPSLEDVESDAKEDFIDNWNNLDKREKQEYINNRNDVFEKIEDELNISSLQTILNNINALRRLAGISDRINKYRVHWVHFGCILEKLQKPMVFHHLRAVGCDAFKLLAGTLQRQQPTL